MTCDYVDVVYICFVCLHIFLHLHKALFAYLNLFKYSFFSCSVFGVVFYFKSIKQMAVNYSVEFQSAPPLESHRGAIMLVDWDLWECNFRVSGSVISGFLRV